MNIFAHSDACSGFLLKTSFEILINQPSNFKCLHKNTRLAKADIIQMLRNVRDKHQITIMALHGCSHYVREVKMNVTE